LQGSSLISAPSSYGERQIQHSCHYTTIIHVRSGISFLAKMNFSLPNSESESVKPSIKNIQLPGAAG